MSNITQNDMPRNKKMKMDDSTDHGTERCVKEHNLSKATINVQDSKQWILFSQGAEARLYKGSYDNKSAIAKERFEKLWRHPILDKEVTTSRFRAEIRAICKCLSSGIICPKILAVDIPNKTIIMEEIFEGLTLKKEIKSLENQAGADDILKNYATMIGELVAKIHNIGMIHGDLTTSNILLNNKTKKELSIIDFGLSYSGKCTAEDRAVDLYVLERALISSHPNMENHVDLILKSYEDNAKDGDKTMIKLHEVRLRGRKREMIG